ncbi:MAG TPA: histidine kinase [Opitutaceae bacterium]|nr:histidine kinase [Opitutaceae bacterium]
METPRESEADTRRYVTAQVVGWSCFTIIYLALSQFAQPVKLGTASIFVAQNCIGLLLSHGLRTVINRRGWKELSWGALIPRVCSAVVVVALLWTTLSWPIHDYLQVEPNDMGLKFSKTAIFIFSTFNGVWLLMVWSLLYFGYHALNRARRAEVDRWQMESAVKEAELRALKSQVNPHFIFNSLNTVRALIHEDPATAETMVTRLAALLRYALQAGQLETVPLERELAIVRDYLAVEKIRFEERLRPTFEIDERSLGLAVPPLLLQTLVENAVKYGVGGDPSGVDIVVSAAVHDGLLKLSVANTGRLSAGGASTGLGLRNATERLRMLFGERAVLRLGEKQPGWVVAEIEMPAKGAVRAGVEVEA